MASIEKRLRDGRTSWRAHYRTPSGAQRNKTFARKIDAEKFLAGVESDKSRGLYVDPSAGRITVGQYAATWQAAQVHRRTTEAAFDSHLRNHILPLLGHRPMGAVTRSEIQGWVKSRSAVLAPSTTTLVYSVLRMIFRSAVADRVIAVSPCERITLPKAPPTQVHPLPVEAVAALAEAVPDRYRALLICAAGTGLRQGEVLGLRRDRVDFLRRMLTVDGQLVLMPGAPPYLAPPKTNASYRSVQWPTSSCRRCPSTSRRSRRPSPTMSGAGLWSCCSPTTAETRSVAPGSTAVSGRLRSQLSGCRPARTSTSSGTSTPRC